MPGPSWCTKVWGLPSLTHHPETFWRHRLCSPLPSLHSQSLSIYKQGLLDCRRQMLPRASIGSHTSVIAHPPSHPSSSPSFYPPSLPSFLLVVSLSWVYIPSSLLIATHSPPTHSPPTHSRPTHSPPTPHSPQLFDLTTFSAAGIHWLPSSRMNSAVHPQGENGYFKAYLASALMSKKSHAVLLMAIVWLQPPRLLGVCLYIA